MFLTTSNPYKSIKQTELNVIYHKNEDAAKKGVVLSLRAILTPFDSQMNAVYKSVLE